jgi:DNA-binding NarL/FixJ family response regulator
MNIIIAHGSEYILDSVRQQMHLSRQVKVVGAFKDGYEALAAIRSLKPDLVIIDHKLQSVSGYRVIEEIRKEDATVVIIILTYFAFENYRQLAMEAGADYFFSLFDDFEKVTRVVNEMLAVREIITPAADQLAHPSPLSDRWPTDKTP